MRRLVACLAALALALAAASSAAGASWAKAHIRVAVNSGLMGPSVPAFRPDDPLTRGELGQIVAGVTRREQVVAAPGRPVTLTELDRALVRALGLAPAADEVRAELAASQLTPPRRAGWETVARLLGLRFNHPAKRDDRELLPNDPATRAEAAFSVARLLALSSWDLERANELATGFDLPPLTDWQRRVLQRAVRFVGYPYVWGGMSESEQTLFGVTSRGGFDCSGFIWRVYKLEGWPGAPRLGATIRSRTAAGMAGEVGVARRVAEARLQPGDVVFSAPDRARRRARSRMPASSSGAAGSCTRRATGRRSCRSTAGTTRRSRGPAGRSPKRASINGRPASRHAQIPQVGDERATACPRHSQRPGDHRERGEHAALELSALVRGRCRARRHRRARRLRLDLALGPRPIWAPATLSP